MSATPPKKGDVEQTQPPQSPDEASKSPPMEHPDTQTQGPAYEFEVKEQDRWLPIANVARIMKMALPENAKIAKEAKECMQECVSEFISFITSEASEKCQQEKRKTVNGEDILFAMTSLGFENYAEALKIYLSRYRESLLANQNKPGGHGAGPGGSAAAGGAAGANAASGSAHESSEYQEHLLSGAELDPEEQANSTFGYTVASHDGNGTAEY